MEDNINKNNDQSWERKGTLPTVNPKRLRERKRREMIVLPWLGCLELSPMCQSVQARG